LVVLDGSSSPRTAKTQTKSETALLADVKELLLN